jgi:hypothetical protein
MNVGTGVGTRGNATKNPAKQIAGFFNEVRVVPMPGLEPGRLAAGDFESYQYLPKTAP